MQMAAGFARIRSVLGVLPEAVGKQMDDHGNRPNADSQAVAEFAKCADSEAPRTLYSQAGIALVVAGDNMFALDRVLTEPVMSFAPWVLGRTILEAASLAMWLLDPTVDLETRMSRSMSLRLSHLRDQATYARTAPRRQVEAEDQLTHAVSHVAERVKSIEMQGRQLGIPLKRDKKGRLIGFGCGMPPATQLADIFGEASTYRLLSGLAHGRMWAQLALGMRRTRSDEPAVEQHVTPVAALFLVVCAVEWFSRPAWNYFQLNGWDVIRLAATLERAYDQVGLGEHTRFWRMAARE